MGIERDRFSFCAVNTIHPTLYFSFTPIPHHLEGLAYGFRMEQADASDDHTSSAHVLHPLVHFLHIANTNNSLSAIMTVNVI